jgi:alpha-N-acetylglucosaminidase
VCVCARACVLHPVLTVRPCWSENAPPSNDPVFLKNYSAATYQAMETADPHSVWVVQAWAFGASYWTNDRLQAYLSGVSNNSMLLLDLVSDQMPLWDGQWPALHNIMPAKCCSTNASSSCADCDGACCDPATAPGGWQGLAASHNYKNYFGKDWVYCSLNNCESLSVVGATLCMPLTQRCTIVADGGNNGVFGLLQTELKAPAAAYAKVTAQGLNNMVGVGLTMEGIHTNWVINEALLEQGWRFSVQSVEEWVRSFVTRRYGSNDANLQAAW